MNILSGYQPGAEVGEMRGFRLIPNQENGIQLEPQGWKYRAEIVEEEGEPRVWNGQNWIGLK